MLFKKYAIVFSLFFSAIAQGAASGASIIHQDRDDSSHSSQEKLHLLPRAIPVVGLQVERGAVDIDSLFDIESITVPEDGLVHAPFVKGRVQGPSFMEMYFSLSKARSFSGRAGFVSGAHREGVVAMASRVGTGLSPASVQVIEADPGLTAYVADCQIEDVYLYTRSGRKSFFSGYVSEGPLRESVWVIAPAAYKKLLETVRGSKKFENSAALTASFKVAAEGLCRLEREKNPDVQCKQVPILVMRQDLTEFMQEIFPPKR